MTQLDGLSAMDSVGGLFRRAISLMRSNGQARWFGLIVLGVAVSLTEVLGAALIYGVVVARAGGQNLADTVPGFLVDAFPKLADGSNRAFAFAISGFFIFRAVLVAVQTFLGSRAVFGTAIATSESLMERYMEQDYLFHVVRGSAALIRNVRESVDTVAYHVLSPLVRAGSEVLVGLGLVAALFVIAPLASAQILGLLVFTGVVTYLPMRWGLRRLGAVSHNAAQGSLKAASELFRGIRDIKLLDSDRTVREPFMIAQLSWGRANYLRSTLYTVPRIVAETALGVGVVALLAFSVEEGIDGERGLALIGLFAYAAIRLIPVTAVVFAALNGLSFGAKALMTVTADLGMPSAGPVPSPDVPMGDSRIDEGLSFEDVWFKYPGASEPAVRGVTLEIAKGETLAIVGPSGSGKSTLVDLLAGLLEPTRGQILADGRNLSSVSGWASSLGVVSQHPFVADDSLVHNIAFGEPDEEIDRERVYHLAELMQIHRFATPERGGLSMRVGEDGFGLSGGERQRIALARALYRSPELLILDEATSALDLATEAVVLEGIRAEIRHGTVVIVAHRESTIRGVDTVVVMVDGALVPMNEKGRIGLLEAMSGWES